MTVVYLVRHGSTPWGEDGNRYTGVSDIALSDTGRRQAHRTARALERVPFDAVYASSLQRAIETAAMLVGPDGEVSIEPDLIEVDFGKWEGVRKADIIAAFPDDWAAWVAQPESTPAGQTGETGAEAVERAINAFDRLAARHWDQTIAVVAHNTLLRLLVVATLGAPLASYRQLELVNCGISIAHIAGDGRWTWKSLNVGNHLETT